MRAQAATENIALSCQRHTTQPLRHCPANTGRRIFKHGWPIGLRQFHGLFGDADETAGALQASGFEQCLELIDINSPERGVRAACWGSQPSRRGHILHLGSYRKSALRLPDEVTARTAAKYQKALTRFMA